MSNNHHDLPDGLDVSRSDMTMRDFHNAVSAGMGYSHVRPAIGTPAYQVYESVKMDTASTQTLIDAFSKPWEPYKPFDI
jgi:hypothetical protein